MSQYIESLKKKLKEFESERTEIQERIRNDNQRLNDLNGAVSGIETLLRIEGVTAPTPPPATAAPGAKANGSTPTLYAVINEVMSDFKPRTEHELIDLAKSRGVDFGEKEPRRTVAFTLMGIARGKKIQRVKDDIWKRVA